MTERLTIAEFKALKKKKPSKYRNEKTVVGDITFDSKKEAARYQHLMLLQKAGEISNLVLQVDFAIIIRGVKICTYIADFVYQDKTGKTIVEDAKGVRTAVYKLKKRMVEAEYKIEILET
jgi:uncharacterized protein DUF1064